ncbi:MAG: hypothetical protein WB994_12490, partial [Candidatus Acidiferrum sp.]
SSSNQNRQIAIQLGKFAIVLALSPEVLAVGPFFVVIPTVVVLMRAGVDAGLLLVIVVAALRRGAGANRQGSRKYGAEKRKQRI